MIFVKDITMTNFGLKKGKQYKILKKGKRRKTEPVILEGVYLGEGGEDNVYVMFRSVKTNITECFLKVDIITGEYRIGNIEKNIKTNKKVMGAYG